MFTLSWISWSFHEANISRKTYLSSCNKLICSYKLLMTAWILFRLTETANQVNVFTTVLQVVTPLVTPALSRTWIATRIWFSAAATPKRTTFNNATACMDQMMLYIPLTITYAPRSEVATHTKNSWNCTTKNHCHLTTADSSQDVKTTVTILMAFYITVAISPRNIAAAPCTAPMIACISTAIYSWWPPPKSTSTPLSSNSRYLTQQEAKYHHSENSVNTVAHDEIMTPSVCSKLIYFSILLSIS